MRSEILGISCKYVGEVITGLANAARGVEAGTAAAVVVITEVVTALVLGKAVVITELTETMAEMVEIFSTLPVE